eukprot:CAMPEP_0197840586 /NCGR_PEP_ID=MMETSP1437-20131217/45691_1 /TAXON_ID=49252 ORGANISM="Eucampia antarctica, Strain CCMP1452" /NCGR_SAMPLE_ID=MMETSP1437 /ASSEMBLY_ACC=CAM_ASM_001096 /LENGTH=299 /DNA_ID=CAMNT_0043450217 /DNA_START=455 /DNA_END=1354 /DNA_ORIENTATION=-
MTSSKTVPEFFRINECPIYFEEDWDTGIGGGLWSTGLAMAKYFQSHPGAVRNNLKRLINKSNKKFTNNDNNEAPLSRRNKISAIELGSGNGFLSICLASLAPDLLDELVVTDLDDHLALMNKIVNANSHIVISEDPSYHVSNPNNNHHDNDTTNTNSSSIDLVKVHVMEHRWGEFSEKDNNNDIEPSCSTTTTASTTLLQKQIQNGTKKFDFIFGSDIAYREWGYWPLVNSFQSFFHEDTVALVGITMIDTRAKFFQILNQAGFRYDRLADHLMAPEFRNNTFGLFVIQKKRKIRLNLK